MQFFCTPAALRLCPGTARPLPPSRPLALRGADIVIAPTSYEKYRGHRYRRHALALLRRLLPGIQDACRFPPPSIGGRPLTSGKHTAPRRSSPPPTRSIETRTTTATAPYSEARDFLIALGDQGFSVIIASHRLAEMRTPTERWLARHHLAYDGLHLSFDKTVLIDHAAVVVVDAPQTPEAAVEHGAVEAGLLFPWNRSHAGNGFGLFPTSWPSWATSRNAWGQAVYSCDARFLFSRMRTCTAVQELLSKRILPVSSRARSSFPALSSFFR